MKIELKINDKDIKLQQESLNIPMAVPLHDTETLRTEDLTLGKHDIVPCIFYYTNNLDFGDNWSSVEFFHRARGHNAIFLNKDITICEDITNNDIVKGFHNRFDVYHITWEILSCDNLKKEEIVKYLTQYCYLEILTIGRLFKYPFTVLSNNLFINMGSFTRIEKNETFDIKLKRSYSGTDSISFKKLNSFLFNTILRIYLHGNYWLEKRN